MKRWIFAVVLTAAAVASPVLAAPLSGSVFTDQTQTIVVPSGHTFLIALPLSPSSNSSWAVFSPNPHYIQSAGSVVQTSPNAAMPAGAGRQQIFAFDVHNPGRVSVTFTYSGLVGRRFQTIRTETFNITVTN